MFSLKKMTKENEKVGEEISKRESGNSKAHYKLNCNTAYPHSQHFTRPNNLSIFRVSILPLVRSGFPL